MLEQGLTLAATLTAARPLLFAPRAKQAEGEGYLTLTLTQTLTLTLTLPLPLTLTLTQTLAVRAKQAEATEAHRRAYGACRSDLLASVAAYEGAGGGALQP